MSAANFCTMRDFPLFAKDYYEDTKRCPECGAIMSEDATECEDFRSTFASPDSPTEKRGTIWPLTPAPV